MTNKYSLLKCQLRLKCLSHSNLLAPVLRNIIQTISIRKKSRTVSRIVTIANSFVLLYRSCLTNSLEASFEPSFKQFIKQSVKPSFKQSFKPSIKPSFKLSFY